MNYKIGDILFFDEYYFTDNGNCKKHFSLVILPTEHTQYCNQIYCSVITSQFPSDGFSIKLEPTTYPCFSRVSYVALLRQDYESLTDLGRNKQAKGHLIDSDFMATYKLLIKILYIQNIWQKRVDAYTRAAIIREWKKYKLTIKLNP